MTSQLTNNKNLHLHRPSMARVVRPCTNLCDCERTNATSLLRVSRSKPSLSSVEKKDMNWFCIILSIVKKRAGSGRFCTSVEPRTTAPNALPDWYKAEAGADFFLAQIVDPHSLSQAETVLLVWLYFTLLTRSILRHQQCLRKCTWNSVAGGKLWMRHYFLNDWFFFSGLPSEQKWMSLLKIQ